MKLSIAEGLLPSKGIFDVQWDSHVGTELALRERMWDAVCSRVEADATDGWVRSVLALLSISWTEVRRSGEYLRVEVTEDGDQDVPVRG